MKGAGAARVDEEKVCWRRYTSGNSPLSGIPCLNCIYIVSLAKMESFYGGKTYKLSHE